LFKVLKVSSIYNIFLISDGERIEDEEDAKTTENQELDIKNDIEIV